MLKDHKDNFENNLKCRLLNPAKNEIGIISRQMLQRKNKAPRDALPVQKMEELIRCY